MTLGSWGALAERYRYSRHLAQISAMMAAYASQASFGKLRIRDPQERMRFFSRNVSDYTRRALKIFNFEIEVKGYDAQLMRERNFLLVGNHMSYIDILVLSSIQPCVFVTSVDMGETAFLGQMAELGGSLFVERRHRNHIGRDIGVMADTLRAGHHVVIYPEGTSHSGEMVHPFKKALLTSAIDAARDVMPIALKYTHINGEPFNPMNRDRICWYGDMDFLSHFLGLMSLESVKAELHFLAPISVTPQSTRHDLAERAHAAINSVYGRPFEPSLVVPNSPDNDASASSTSTV